MNGLFGFITVLLALFLSNNIFAQTIDSFTAVFNKLAKDKGVSMPANLEKKAFEFVPIIKPGEKAKFKMGRTTYKIIDNKSNNQDEDQYPVHKVKLKQPFEMQKTELTQLQWVLIMDSNPSIYKDSDYSLFTGGEKVFYNGWAKFNINGKGVVLLCNRPVESVSYNDVQVFISKLNKLDSKYNYRLPTEAEWEYSARAGTTTEYFFGDDGKKLTDYAWYHDNNGEPVFDYKNERTHDVGGEGKKLPNQFGLYDVSGNVWEWTSDYYGSYDKNEVTDPKGPSNGPSHVFRGGGWNCLVNPWCLPTYRGITMDKFVAPNINNENRGTDDIASSHIGFRLVRTTKN